MNLRHQLHSSRLLILLQQWAQADGGSPRADVAEQLGKWLSTVDAVKLSRALHTIESYVPPPQVVLGAVDGAALQALYQAARVELMALVSTKPAPPKPARLRPDNTLPEGPDLSVEAEFATHGARYTALQKQMELTLGGLRVQLRQAMAKGPVHLRQLGALDSVMEQMTGAREQRLWAFVPTQLEKRMAHWRGQHQQRLAATGQADDPQRWRRVGGWLYSFEQDLRALALAELQVRLQLLQGLVEAVLAPAPRSAPVSAPSPPPTPTPAPATTASPESPESRALAQEP